MDYGQALRVTTIFNIILITPVLVTLSLRLYTYLTKWFKAQPLPFIVVLFVNTFVISIVVLPFLLGMLAVFIPTLQ